MTSHNVARDFVNMLVGSRLVNIYLKTIGIIAINTNTMVPVAILFGREAFKAVVNGERKQQIGGKILEKIEIPLLDDPYIGSYLLLLGVTSLRPETLIPVGLAAAIYELYFKKHV